MRQFTLELSEHPSAEDHKHVPRQSPIFSVREVERTLADLEDTEMPPSLPSDSRFLPEFDRTINELKRTGREEDAQILAELRPFVESLARPALPAEEAQKLVSALKLTGNLEAAFAASRVYVDTEVLAAIRDIYGVLHTNGKDPALLKLLGEQFVPLEMRAANTLQQPEHIVGKAVVALFTVPMLETWFERCPVSLRPRVVVMLGHLADCAERSRDSFFADGVREIAAIIANTCGGA